MSPFLFGFGYGFFVLYPMLVILIGGILSVIAAVVSRPPGAPRPHDPRPNGWMALMHWNHLRYSAKQLPPAEAQPTAPPVTAQPAPAPTVIYIHVQPSAVPWPPPRMLEAAQKTGLLIGGNDEQSDAEF